MRLLYPQAFGKRLCSSLFILSLTLSSFSHTQAFAETLEDHEELLRIQQQQQSAYDALNRNNPFSSQASQGPAPSSLPAANLNPQLAAVQNLLAHPIVQSFLRFFAHPGLSSAIDQMLKNPYRTHLMYTEIGWFVFFIFFRSWRLSVLTTSWLRKLFFRFWSFLLYGVVSSIVIPFLFLGQPYLDLLNSVFSTFFKTI